MQNRSNLNIDIFSKDEFLYVRFDVVTSYSSSSDEMKKILLLADLNAVTEKFASDPYSYPYGGNDNATIRDKNILMHLLQMSPKEPGDINSLKGVSNVYEIMNNSSSHAVITYRISNIPHALINWIACYNAYMNIANSKSMFGHFQFSDHTKFTNINNETDTTDFFSADNCETNSVISIMEKILCVKTSLKSYQNALDDLETIYKYYTESCKTNPKSLLQCLSDITRCDLIYKDQIEKLSLMQNGKEKELGMMSFTLANEPTFKKVEFLFMLELVNSSEKINLIQPCFGTNAHDGIKYSMVHTELQLLYFADFYLYPNGKMAIINLDKNPAYIESYTEGKRGYNILTDEIRFLANCLGLELEPDCDYHKDKQIMFTPTCSLKLANLGLHINANYSIDVFKAYNMWAFFTKVRLAGDNVFKGLPEEVVDKIIVTANPSYQRYFNNKLHPGFFHAVNLGKEKGFIEHQEKMTNKFKM